MKLFRHYKRKPYKYIGLARHSETLEEMVIYETRYENDNGKVWVRPKEMFFESIQKDAVTVPRFEKIELKIVEDLEPNEETISRVVAPIMERAFGQWDATWFYSDFNSHKKTYLQTAVVENQVVGFKLGYELSSRKFYSWLGGVHPEFRGLGIASSLMKAQHDWCLQQGYQKIQTKTQNRFRAMLLLNIKQGFDIIGTQDSDEGGMKIILEKSLKSWGKP